MKYDLDQPLPKRVDSESDYGSDDLLGSCVGSNIFGRTLFGFISPVIRIARTEGKLHEDDVPEHTMDLDTKVLFDCFSKEWQIQQAKENPSMSRSLAAGRWHLLILTGIGYIVAQALSLAGPQLLKQIVQGLTCRQLRNESPEVEFDGCEGGETRLYLFACGLFIAPLAQAFIETHNVYVLEQLGLVFRNSLMGAIYRKTLKLNSEALNAASTGKIVTLMSNDAQKLQEVMMSLHTAWGAPLFIIAILILLYVEIQWSAFVGLAAMLLLVPASTFIGKKLGNLRRQIVGFTDKRTSYMGEIINGIRVIKFYAWELPFRKRVRDVRGEEAKVMRTMATYQAFFGLTLFVGPVMVSIASFAAYTGAGNELTPTKAYTSLALFTLLRFPLAFLPSVIFNVINAKIALNRIAKFLMSGEVLEDDKNFITRGVTPGYVEIRNGLFSWGNDSPAGSQDGSVSKSNGKNGKPGKDAGKKGVKGKGKPGNESKGATSQSDASDTAKEDKPALHNINLKCEPGSLTMVVGAVGSGKSSLLATLFQQITRMEGSVKVGGTVAYVPQTAWIMNETVRENVLMGNPLDERKYEKALRCAQLASDLAQLPDGDLTEIGERGVTLSGGQKQRVSIARAVYADADVVIMDDPLSAVDAHVGKALFEDCLVHELGDKTVLLVTNALHFLHVADQVVWIVDGRLRKVGTYKELSDDDEFMELVGSQVVAEDVASDEEAQDEDAVIEDGAAAPPKSEGHMITKQVEKKGLTGTEERTVGALSWGVVSLYVMAAGGMLWVGLVMLLYILEQTSKIMTDTWVGWWSTDRLDQGKDNLMFYLGIYAAIAVGFGMITLARSLHFSYGAVRAAVNLHNALLDRVLRLPVSFFDTNPSGRIINRFSRDTEIMDSVLPQSLVQVGACTFSYFGILAVISIATPWFVLMLPPVTVVYYFLQRYYIPAARELQRLESVTRSPIYSGFGEAVNGIATIRAFNKANHFVQLEDHLISNNGLLFLTQRAGTAWLSLRLDAIGLTVLTAAGLLAVASRIDPSFAGLSLIYALDLTKFLKFGTRIASKTETDFNSVERIAQYLEEEEEADPETRADPDTRKWPTKGAVQVKKVVMRYRANLPAVLRSVSFSVAGGEHVGIVGRTGSGKSSLFLVFFRIVEPEAGKVIVDGVNIGNLGLTTLRKSLSMIPQDPFMFSGSVRRNLDPFDNYSDTEVWQALEAVSLKPTIAAFDDKLQATVTDNGGNFSQGQRQLFCLARALLKKSRILMMDEATASVDLETDALIQKVIRDKFANCTVLTIAHRLNTIMDSDKVLVMDAGQAAEYDTPHVLLQEPDSLFTGLVENTGKNAAKILKDMAQASHARAGDNMYYSGAAPPASGGYYDIAGPPPVSGFSEQSQQSRRSSRGGHLRASGDGAAHGPPHSMTYEGSSSDYFGVPAPRSRRSTREEQRRLSLGSSPYPTSQDDLPRSSCDHLPPVYENSLVGGLVGPYNGDPTMGPGYPAVVPEAALYSWYSASAAASVISGDEDSEYNDHGGIPSRRTSGDYSRDRGGSRGRSRSTDRPGSWRARRRSAYSQTRNIRWTGTQHNLSATDTTSWIA